MQHQNQETNWFNVFTQFYALLWEGGWAFSFLWHKSWGMGLLWCIVSTYLVFWETANYFSEWLYILPSHQKLMSDPVSPHSHQSLLMSLCFILDTPIFVQWYLILVLVCIFLMVNHAEYLFMRLFSLPTPFPQWWSVFHVFIHFLIELYVFSLLCFKNFYIF